MNDIKKYESMAKLNLPEPERILISGRANALIESFKELNKINTDEVEPLLTVLDIKNILRDDIAVKLLSREELLSNAPEQYDGYFQAPKTV